MEKNPKPSKEVIPSAYVAEINLFERLGIGPCAHAGGLRVRGGRQAIIQFVVVITIG